MSDRPRNAFLRSLGDESYSLLSGALVRVELPLGTVLYDAGQAIDWVYFPETCLLSVLTTTLEGDTVETAMVGTEGALLLLEGCSSRISTNRCLAQIDGYAWRAPASLCATLMREKEDFARSALNLFELQIGESRQSGMCLGLHSVETRMARWLLESSVRACGRTEMPLTQEFIAAMLGVQRTTVTAFAVQLQKFGLIRYSRARVELLDMSALEQRACECRKVTAEDRTRLGLVPYVPQQPELKVVGS